MTAEVLLPQVQACAVRVSLLTTAGRAVGGASGSYMTSALVKATITPVYTDGAEIKEENACGRTFIDYISDDSFTRADVEFDFLAPDPLLHSILLSGGSVLTGAWGKGWAYPPIGALTGQLAVELWAKRIDNGIQDPTFPYAWWTLPLVKNCRIGAREFSNTTQHSTITGRAYENSQYFDGPGNDWPAASSRVAQWIPTAAIPAGLDSGAYVNYVAS